MDFTKNLSGTIMSSIGKWPNATNIFFCNNYFTGSPPPSIVKLSSIKNISLTINKSQAKSPLKPSIKNGFIKLGSNNMTEKIPEIRTGSPIYLE